MSENIPTTSTSLHHKKSKRKYDKIKLPTPPPDPTVEKSDDRDDFLAYLDSLQKSSCSRSPPPPPQPPTTSTIFTPAIATEDAFDHLEKLYKLMEQMLELREQNVRLHRRIRDLEHVHNLEKMYKQLDVSCVQGECPELDKDTAFAETILESILQETKSPSKKSRLRQSISRRRNRSGSITETEFTHNIPQYRRASTCIDNRQSSTTKSSKVSKWTKVKAAFKWEKASSSVSDAKSQDSGIGGNNSVPVEVARYLRVPSMATSGDDASGHSPVDSGAGAEISSTPGTLSTASSNDDFHSRNELHSPCEDFKSSDDEHSHVCNISHSKDGSQKSNKSHHKTPWAKMKDIIQTRNSFKKKHRLSAQSDDIQIDIELCSDNEDVFDDNDQRTNSDEVPPDIVARYQQAVAEDGNIAEKKTSKWTRVKKAFLAPNETVQSAPPSPQPKDNNQMRFEEVDKNTIEAEIQKNYKQLQKKLSIEFQEKLSEWERMKQTSPNTTNPSSSSCMPDENRDPVFAKKMEEWQKIKSQPSFKRSIPMTSEENLPPEFRKKLQEWERIRKNSHKEATTAAAVTSRKKLADVPKWKSLSSNRNDNSPTIEYPVITEEFRKKLNEWKQIKASGGVSSDDNDKRKELKTSPGLSRKNSSTKICKKHEKDMQWFEKELSKIEKEKQRLERERQKFLEREERLSKLRNSVIGSNKKEILIHTPSGFHRFEGISRKFAQKLYEWEKAQGIGPESSTFALLHSSLVQDTNINPRPSNPTVSLIRSKSADSIAISALNLTCPLMSQPSSLSLNNVEDLEKECLVDSKSSSQETLNEPEALIVEVEDIVEETAAPLRTFRDKTQQPVYQREELKAMCEGETCIAPKVRRSESTKAQNNYYLIEEIFNILAVLTENELEIQKTQDSLIDTAENLRNDPNFMKLQGFDEAQRNFSVRLSDKVTKLQEANSTVLSNLTKDNPPENFIDISETIQDLSTEILQLTERLNREISNRNIYESFQAEAGARSLTPILEAIKDLRSKILEMRRRLSYICAASDLTAPGKKISQKKSTKKIISDEASKENEISKSGSEKNRFYIKSENSNVQSQGAIKKRIRYRQKTLQNRNALDTDDEEENMETKRSTHKKLTRTRSISEGSADKILENSNKPPNNQIIVDEALIQKIVVPTKTNYVTVSETNNTPSVDTPVSIFVKTTRKIFTPIAESSAATNKDEKLPECAVKIEEPEKNREDETVEKQIEDRLPPLPASPPLQRKTKDISPSIRLMLAKYNQKLEESSCKSGASSGSISPAWRSPKSERRVKAQTEKYQKDLNQLSPNFSVRREVQKSASVGFLQNININETVDCSNQNNQLLEQNLIKSTSTSIISNKKTNLKLELNETDMPRHSPEIRLKKLQKAKEEFLNSTPQSAPPQITDEQQPIEFPTRNRLSQISVGSDSSHDSSTFNGSTLMKSASAGMINIDATAYRQINPEIHGGGYVSLPRQTNKQQKSGLFVNGKFAFSQIASKFRKVKMRKGKDKMNVVPILCRQSLVVDINQEDEQQQQEEQQDLRGNNQRSNDDSNNSKSTSSWLKKRTKLFKK